MTKCRNLLTSLQEEPLAKTAPLQFNFDQLLFANSLRSQRPHFVLAVFRHRIVRTDFGSLSFASVAHTALGDGQRPSGKDFGRKTLPVPHSVLEATTGKDSAFTRRSKVQSLLCFSCAQEGGFTRHLYFHCSLWGL
jgi:hypothetical protein